MKPDTQPDYTEAVRKNLVDAIQAVARRTNPKANIVIDDSASIDGYSPDVVLMCGVGRARLPVDVKHSYATAVGPVTRNGKVTISVNSGAVLQSRTCNAENWTPKRLMEVAEIVWTQFAVNQMAALAQVERWEVRHENEQIADGLNITYDDVPGARIDGSHSTGLRLDADLTKWEAKAVLDLLKVMRTSKLKEQP